MMSSYNEVLLTLKEVFGNRIQVIPRTETINELSATM